MTGGKVFGPDSVGKFFKCTEFDVAVAGSAGIGSTAGFIFRPEVILNGLKFHFHIKGMKRYFKLVCNQSGITGIISGTTSLSRATGTNWGLYPIP
jgi:hypothetical protein